jgi:hypothetical protein
VYGLALQICVVSVGHRSAIWEVFFEEIFQPHSFEVAFSLPGAVGVAVDTGEGNYASGGLAN